MSTEPRNGLWNRLLSRAEARAKEGVPPEPHCYFPVSAGDDHLRVSLENSLVYHGLKIETEFNLRLQRPPRKRKAKRKTDLPVAERLRNDRAAAGSPGPTHRPSTAAPARRISKTTPLSRPLIPPPPPPAPPMLETGRAKAQKEAQLKIRTKPKEARLEGDSAVLTVDSSDDEPLATRKSKLGATPPIVLQHFDEAENSNDTSSWEEHAILVKLPPSKEQNFDQAEETAKLHVTDSTEEHPDSGVGAVSASSKQLPSRPAKVRNNKGSASSPETSAILEYVPAHKISRRDNPCRSRTRKVSSSDSESTPDFSAGQRRSEVAQKRKTKTEGVLQDSRVHAEDISKPERAKGETRKDMPLERTATCGSVDDHESCDHEGTACEKSLLVGHAPQSRLRKLSAKETEDRELVPASVYLSSSSSEQEPPIIPRRRRSPMQALMPLRACSFDTDKGKKLPGVLSPVSSPRKDTRSIKKGNDKESTLRGMADKARIKVRSANEARPTSMSPSRDAEHLSRRAHETPRRKSPRKLTKKAHGENGDGDLEVVATGPSTLKGRSQEQTCRQSLPSCSRSQRKTVRKTATSEQSWEEALEEDVAIIDIGGPRSSEIRILGKDKLKRNRSKPRSKLSSPEIDMLNAANNFEDSQGDISPSKRTSRSRKQTQLANQSSGGPMSPSTRKKTKTLRQKGSARDERGAMSRAGQNESCLEHVVELLDYDSDVVFVSSSPIRGRNQKEKRDRHAEDHSAKETAELSDADTQEVIMSSDDFSQPSTMKIRKQHTPGVPPRIPRPLGFWKNRSKSSDDSGAPDLTKSHEDDKETKLPSASRSLPLRVRLPAELREKRRKPKPQSTEGAGASSELPGLLQSYSNSAEELDHTLGKYAVKTKTSADSYPKNGGPKRRSPHRRKRDFSTLDSGSVRGCSEESTIGIDCSKSSEDGEEALQITSGSNESNSGKKRKR